MRRFVTLLVLLLFTVPFGISLAGCGKKTTVVFCNGGDSGPVVGQLVSLTLNPLVYGISLNSGQFGQVATPSGVDCKGSSSTPTNVTYGVYELDSSNKPVATNLVDVVPSGVSAGRLCAGTWNRNTGGGIPDYTVCTPSPRNGTAYVTASSGGANSNALPIFIHPVVTSIIVGPPSTNCSTDLATNCCAFSTTGSATAITGTYTGNSCLSQNVTGQLAARVFAGSGSSQTNITCSRTGTDSSGNPIFAPLVGHLLFTPQDSSVVTIDENGIATAKYPGTTVVNATVATASSSVGLFSTCPPANITLSVPNVTGNPQAITVNQNNTQPLTAIVTDTNGATLNGISLQFVSTTPRTLPSGGTGTVTPIFPGSGAITAVCQPPTCNNAPLNEIGLFGTGTPISSNPITVNTPGTNSTVLYAASTQSLNLTFIDFATNSVGAAIRLPFVPTSMALSTDGLSLYLGSTTELMAVSTTSGGLIGQYEGAPGNVLAVSPDSTTVVVTDPNRKTVSLVTPAGAIITTYGGVGTAAQWSPDSTTVYIAAGNQLIVHATQTGWHSVALPTVATGLSIAKPAIGAFLAGTTTTAHGYCPITTVSGSGDTVSTTNQYFPDAGLAGPATDLVTATNDGVHLLGATVTPAPTLTDLVINIPSKNDACPPAGQTITGNPVLTSILPGITASAITGVDDASDSSLAFITYLGTGGVLPFYAPAATGAGTLGSVQLSGAATDPLAGVFSSDNNTFFVGTAGDNLIHLINRGTSGFTDTGTVNPQIVDGNGNSVPANLLQQRPRKIT